MVQWVALFGVAMIGSCVPLLQWVVSEIVGNVLDAAIARTRPIAHTARDRYEFRKQRYRKAIKFGEDDNSPWIEFLRASRDEAYLIYHKVYKGYIEDRKHQIEKPLGCAQRQNTESSRARRSGGTCMQRPAQRRDLGCRTAPY